MAIQKMFYKKTARQKVFFSKEMNVRSFAHGQAVHEEFIDWQKLFFEKRQAYPNEFMLSTQPDIYGFGLGINEKGIDKSLVRLSIEGNSIELQKDNFIYINGKRSTLYAGSEVKAYAGFYFQHDKRLVKGLAIISKVSNEEGTKLRLFRWNRDTLESDCFASVALPSTMEANSYLVCLGKHIFLVHNSILDYYYVNIDDKALERVAIGKDTDEVLEWCRFVNPAIVTMGQGYVFWWTDDTVYGFSIGYPYRLVKIETNGRERIVRVQGEEDGILVFRKDKNTGKENYTKHMITETGTR